MCNAQSKSTSGLHRDSCALQRPPRFGSFRGNSKRSGRAYDGWYITGVASGCPPGKRIQSECTMDQQRQFRSKGEQPRHCNRSC